MRKLLIMMVFASLISFPINKAWGGYSGPLEIFSGPLDDRHSTDQVDGLGSNLALKFIVLSDGSYVEIDTQNNISVYRSSGLLRQFNVSQGQGLHVTPYFFDQYIFVVGSGKIKRNIYVYDYTGNRSGIINSGSYMGDLVAVLPNGDFITNVWKTENYYRYSLSGQFVKAYTSKPQELGMAKSQSLGGGKYKTTITFDDRACSIVTHWEYDKSMKLLRDESKNLYVLDAGSVDKFSPCGKLLGQVNMPSDAVYTEGNVVGRDPEIIEHDLYGEPQIDVHGNIYTWKKTPTKYSIIKWTWADDPSVQAGPDAPTNLAVSPSINGLFLSWAASPNDPGCVTQYEISRATSAGGIGTTVATVNAGTLKYNDASASAGTTYYYKIRAVSGSDYSLYTSEVSGKR